MALEIGIAEEFIFSRLNADLTLRALGIHGDLIASSDPVYPSVVFQYQGGESARTLDGSLIFENLLYLVKVIGKTTSTASLKDYTARIRAQLHQQTGATAQGLVLACVEQEPFKLSELTGGDIYKHLGSFYRLSVQAF